MTGTGVLHTVESLHYRTRALWNQFRPERGWIWMSVHKAPVQSFSLRTLTVLKKASLVIGSVAAWAGIWKPGSTSRSQQTWVEHAVCNGVFSVDLSHSLSYFPKVQGCHFLYFFSKTCTSNFGPISKCSQPIIICYFSMWQGQGEKLSRV